MPLTQVETSRFNSLNLAKYNVLILPNGNFGSLNVEKVKQFVQDGGTIIATGKSMNWLKNAGLAAIEFRNAVKKETKRQSYSGIEEAQGAKAMPGAIFEASLDLSHPLCFGYIKSKIPVFLGDTIFVSPGKNPYSTPAIMTDSPLMAGYIHKDELPLASNSAVAIIYGIGRGKIICFPGDPNFRAFWLGTNRLFANAIFFGNLIDNDSTEKK
jgi:hypothetical protein